MEVAEGVATVGELKVLTFPKGAAAKDRGLLVNSRLPDWFARGAIPGMVNAPFSTLDPETPY